jgi:plasmid stabilization system protein ParE
MAASLFITPEASIDVEEAYAWYESRHAGLGEQFLSCVDARIQQICRSPEIHPMVHEECRRAMVRRFPYAVFYEYVGDEVTVYCIFHTSRDPEKWRDRLP